MVLLWFQGLELSVLTLYVCMVLGLALHAYILAPIGRLSARQACVCLPDPHLAVTGRSGQQAEMMELGTAVGLAFCDSALTHRCSGWATVLSLCFWADTEL